MLDTWHRLERVIKWTGLSDHIFCTQYRVETEREPVSNQKREQRDQPGSGYVDHHQVSFGEQGVASDRRRRDVRRAGSGLCFSGRRPLLRHGYSGGRRRDGPALAAVLHQHSVFDNCDIAARTSVGMLPEIAPGAIVILKRWNVESIVPGESYLVVTEQFKGIRTIRAGSNPSELLLLPANTQQYDPIVIGKSDIVKLFIVQGIIVKKNL